MSLLFPGVVACICYVTATLMQVMRMLKGIELKGWIKSLGSIAVVFHAVVSYQDFNGEAGIDLGLYPMLSLMALSIVTIVITGSLKRPVDNLFILIFPIATVTIILDLLLRSESEHLSEVSSGILAHIVLSIIAYSLLTIAAVQAILLSLGDNLLRHHRIAVLRNMPPLETMEQLMFEMLWVGLIFLTLSIASGFVFLQDIAGPGLVHHTVITLAAWIVFSILLWGRHQLGWRGAIASRWTLTGFALLALGYFGSKFVIEIILTK